MDGVLNRDYVLVRVSKELLRQVVEQGHSRPVVIVGYTTFEDGTYDLHLQNYEVPEA